MIVATTKTVNTLTFAALLFIQDWLSGKPLTPHPTKASNRQCPLLIHYNIWKVELARDPNELLILDGIKHGFTLTGDNLVLTPLPIEVRNYTAAISPAMARFVQIRFKMD